MLSLVAAYSDSNSSEESEEEEGNSKEKKISKIKTQPVAGFGNQNLEDEDEGSPFNNSQRKLRTGVETNEDLIEDEDEDFVNFNAITRPSLSFGRPEEEEEDEEDEEDEEEASTKSTKSPAQRLHLSNPFRQNPGSEGLIQGDSVFEIPFLDQETKKSAALERHVKMTQVAGTHEMINGKKICWNYRKGKCRFGHNCTFAHDSDIQQAAEKKSAESKSRTEFNPAEQPVVGKEEEEADVIVSISSPHLGVRSSTSAVKVHSGELSPERKIHEGIGKKGKKRHGLAQTLHPGKKVMKAFYQNQS